MSASDPSAPGLPLAGGGGASIPATPAAALLNAGAPSTIVALDGSGVGTSISYAATLAAIGGAATVTTTRGDMIRRGASADERVGLGASGTVLTSDGADAVWSPPAPAVATLSVSSTNAASGTAAGTASTITLTTPAGTAVTGSRAAEPSVVLGSTGAVTRCEVVLRLATVTNTTSLQGIAIGLGDDGGAGLSGAGAVLGFRVALAGQADVFANGSTVVWSNYSPGALTLDGDTWLRMVTTRDGGGAVFTGRGTSRAAVAWTLRWRGAISLALADNARANLRALIYVSSGTTPVDITAAITSIEWASL